MNTLTIRMVLASALIFFPQALAQTSSLNQELNKAFQLTNNSFIYAVNQVEGARGMAQKFQALETVATVQNEQEVDSSEKYDRMFARTLKSVCNLEYEIDQMIKVLQEKFLYLPIGTQEENDVKRILHILKRTWYNLLEYKVLYEAYHNYQTTQRILTQSSFLKDAQSLRTFQDFDIRGKCHHIAGLATARYLTPYPFLGYQNDLKSEIAELLQKLSYFDNAEFKLSTPAATNDFESDMFEFTQHLKNSLNSLKALDALFSEYLSRITELNKPHKGVIPSVKR